MPKFGLNTYGPTIPYYYADNDTASLSVGIDGADSDKLKITALATTGAYPTTTAQIIIDPAANGHITLSPNGTGTVDIDYITQYYLLIGGASGAVEDLADGLGTSGQVLTSKGAGAEPTWEDTANPTKLDITFLDDTDSPYTVLSTDVFMSCDVSAGALTVQLPNAPSTGRVYYIKDSTGSAATFNITVTTVGGAVTIDGGTSYVMNTDYQSVSVIFDGTEYSIF